MNNYIPIKKKRNRRSNPDTIIMAARLSGGGKNKIRIRVTIPKKILKEAFGFIPPFIRITHDIDEDGRHLFALYNFISDKKEAFALTQTSTNIYTFWINADKQLEYFLNIDYGESYNIRYSGKSSMTAITFGIKEVKHAE